MPNIKNIIIFVSIGAAFILIYIFFIRQGPPEADLISSSPSTSSLPADNTSTLNENSPAIAQDFLTLLLSVKDIKLDDSIFSDLAFMSLSDSSITLTPDGDEGRPNPFAPLGSDAGSSNTSNTTESTTPPSASNSTSVVSPPTNVSQPASTTNSSSSSSPPPEGSTGAPATY